MADLKKYKDIGKISEHKFAERVDSNMSTDDGEPGNNSFIEKAKNFAITELGINPKTLVVKPLSETDSELLGKDFYAFIGEDVVYFLPNEKDICEDCALKEVRFLGDGKHAEVIDIPLNEENASLIYNVYPKHSVSHDVDYQDKIDEMYYQSSTFLTDEIYEQEQQVLTNQFQEPVTQIFDEEEPPVFRVGHWGNDIADVYSKYSLLADKNVSAEEKKEILEFFKEYDYSNFVKSTVSNSLKPALKRMHTEIADNLEESVAYYSKSDSSITLKEFSEEDKNKLKENLKQQIKEGGEAKNEAEESMKTHYTLYALGDPMAQIATLYHENNHKNDYDNNKGKSLLKTPKNAVRAQRLTEVKSVAVEYLSVAHHYMELKEKGFEKLEVNGEQKPLEYMLEMYPGLKEDIVENGFDVHDPQSVRRVVTMASKSWHDILEADYDQNAEEALFEGICYFNIKPMSEQLKLLKNEDKNYQQISDAMLKNTYIGQNTTVDLRHCRDVLDTMSEENIQKFGISDYVMSYDEMKAVNDYLEKKGLKKDSDKMQYMSEYLNNKGFRIEQDSDPELTDLLLSYNNSVLCADGLEYSKEGDGMVVFHKDGQDYTCVPSANEQSNDIINIFSSPVYSR